MERNKLFLNLLVYHFLIEYSVNQLRFSFTLLKPSLTASDCSERKESRRLRETPCCPSKST